MKYVRQTARQRKDAAKPPKYAHVSVRLGRVAVGGNPTEQIVREKKGRTYRKPPQEK